MTDTSISTPVFGRRGLPTGFRAPLRDPEQLRISYVERPGLLKLAVTSWILTIITLGFYRFWAKTRVRKHIWSCIHINDEPLEYTGTAMELFLGFLMVFALVIMPFALGAAGLGLYYGPDDPHLWWWGMIYRLVAALFTGFAIHRARRYQLSRTLWRGIRGALVGSSVAYSFLYFGSLIAKWLSLGWATPVMNTVLQEQITNDMRFGDAAFKFKGPAGPLYPTYAIGWFLTIGAAVVLFMIAMSSIASLSLLFGDFTKDVETKGYWALAVIVIAILVFYGLWQLVVRPILWSAYIAKEMTLFASYTRFDGAQFKLETTAWDVIVLTVVNLLLVAFTLGLAWPFANQRIVRFYADRLKLEGHIDIDRIRQSQEAILKRGEGLADAFEVGGL